MNQLNNVSNTDSFRTGIDKLFQIGNMAIHLSCQIQEVTTIFCEESSPDTDPSPTGKVSIEGGELVDNLSSMDNLTSQELLELSNLENTRQAVVKSWRYIEARKAKIINRARARLSGREERQ